MHWTQHWWRQVKREYLEIVRRREQRVAAARDRGVRHVRVAGDGETAGFLSADSAQPSVTAARHTCHVSRVNTYLTNSIHETRKLLVRASFPLVWLLGYLVTCYNSPFALISSLSHFAHLLHTTSNTCIHTELSFMWDNANEMLHICHSFVSLQNVAWWGFMLPVVSNISFFGARHRPGRFSSRVSNFDIELYINIHNI